MKHKRGDINYESGLVFWQYRGEKEVWLTAEDFTEKHRRTKAHGKQYHAANRERLNTQMRERARRNKYWLTPQHQEWRAKNQHKLRLNRLKNTYGMTGSEYDEMFADQRGVCAICSKPQPDGRLLCVDHCHQNGRVRQHLCVHCNAGLGQFFDNPDSLRRAADYIEKHARTKQHRCRNSACPLVTIV